MYTYELFDEKRITILVYQVNTKLNSRNKGKKYHKIYFQARSSLDVARLLRNNNLLETSTQTILRVFYYD